MRALFSLLLIVPLLAGCGYHLQGRGEQTPGGIGSVYIEIFANATLEPYLESVVTEFVTDRFARGRALRVVNRAEKADGVLSGRVFAYASDPVAYASEDEILQYRSSMTVTADLRRVGTGELLWRGNVAWSEEYQASPDRQRQEDNEASAIRIISQRIADELYSRMSEGF